MRNSQVLLIVDMQKEGLLNRKVYNKKKLIENINNLINFFRENNKLIIFVRHTNQSFLKENTDGWQFCEELDILEEDVVINKRHSNVFREKYFISFLKENNIKEVVVTGLITDGCVKAACLGALEMGLSVVLVSDGHSTFHKNAEKIISDWNLYLREQGAILLSTSDILQSIK